MFVSVLVCLSVGSLVTPLPWLVVGSCLRVTAIIIITQMDKPSRTIDLLGSSFLIHVETSKGVNSTIGKPWNVFSEFRTCFLRVWKPAMAVLCLREATRVFWPMTCVRRVKHVCAWSNMCAHGQSLCTHAYVCMDKVEGRIRFLVPFGLQFLHQGFSMIPMT